MHVCGPHIGGGCSNLSFIPGNFSSHLWTLGKIFFESLVLTTLEIQNMVSL